MFVQGQLYVKHGGIADNQDMVDNEKTEANALHIFILEEIKM